jgi:competence protein ComEC
MSSPYENYQDELSSRLYELAQEEGIKIYYFDDNDKLEYHELALECVFPSRDIKSYESANDMSMVLKLSFYDLSILLTGDIEAGPENYLVAENKNITADIIKVPHHGSNTSSTQEFVEEVNGQVAILSYGEHNVFGHPAQSVVKRYEEANYIAYHTAIDGAITLKMTYPYNQYSLTTYLTNRKDSYPCNN